MLLYNNSDFIAMQKGLDMLWLKQKAISDNIANAETPGYKAKSVSFNKVLSNEFYLNNPDAVGDLEPVISIDHSSIRADGNNVDVDSQSLELWRSYAQYSYLREKLSSQIKNMRYVINNLD